MAQRFGMAIKPNVLITEKNLQMESFFIDLQKYIHMLDSLSSNTNNVSVESNETTITTCNIVQYSINEKWIHGISAISNNSTKLFSGNVPDTLKELLFEICEELELISRDSSNDEGQGSSVAAGVRFDGETEHPDVLIQEGL